MLAISGSRSRYRMLGTVFLIPIPFLNAQKSFSLKPDLPVIKVFMLHPAFLIKPLGPSLHRNSHNSRLKCNFFA